MNETWLSCVDNIQISKAGHTLYMYILKGSIFMPHSETGVSVTAHMVFTKENIEISVRCPIELAGVSLTKEEKQEISHLSYLSLLKEGKINEKIIHDITNLYMYMLSLCLKRACRACGVCVYIWNL